MREIICYTDGSAVANGAKKGQGGFGVYFPNHYGIRRAWSGGSDDTKTGRMELTALLTAIKTFYYSHKEPLRLVVYSDSQYVVKSFTEKRLEKWIRNGWRNSSGEVKNLDLWKQVVQELKSRQHFMKLEMRWIKAHQLDKCTKEERKELLTNPHIHGNAIADRLADYKRHN